MSCTSPLPASRGAAGQVLVGRASNQGTSPFEVPCGQCADCRLTHARSWATRAVHEKQVPALDRNLFTDDAAGASAFEDALQRSSFVTLTYDEEHLPPDRSLQLPDVQRFMKRLRKTLGPCRFLHCGEYGPKTLRPHYHFLIYGHDFLKGSSPCISKSGENSWTSPELEQLWPFGIHQVGELTFDSACYVARYVMKKRTRPNASDPVVRRDQWKRYDDAYQRVDPTTGECWYVKPEYVTMSRNPGLGAAWFEKYGGEVFPRDRVVQKGLEMKPPKFYDARAEAIDADMMERVKTQRSIRAQRRSRDETPARRKVRAKVRLLLGEQFERMG